MLVPTLRNITRNVGTYSASDSYQAKCQRRGGVFPGQMASPANCVAMLRLQTKELKAGFKVLVGALV